MFDIRVERLINKDINTVFDVLADHEGYSRFKGVKKAVLIEHGASEKNGLGALRHIDLGAVKFDERITCFDRPYRLDYKIEKSRPLPFQHELGSISLHEENGATKVIWVSKGSINIPILGKHVFDKIFERKGHQGFGSILKSIDHAIA
ncbi:MAG: hypothetical protein ACI89D_000862 [Bermanella sp.]|jgi:hypothetical protein